MVTEERVEEGEWQPLRKVGGMLKMIRVTGLPIGVEVAQSEIQARGASEALYLMRASLLPFYV